MAMELVGRKKENRVRIRWMKVLKDTEMEACSATRGATVEIVAGAGRNWREEKVMTMMVKEERWSGVGISREEAKVKKAKRTTMEEHWSGLRRALGSWRDDFVRAMSDGIAEMAGAGVRGMQEMQERRRPGLVALFANVSNAVAFGDGSPQRFISSAEEGGGGTASRVSYLPKRGTYAYDALLRRFKELDQDGLGYISEGDLKAALKDLKLPASEKNVRDFMNQIVDRTQASEVSFEQFAEYAVQRENELLDTFKELDQRKIGYITEHQLKVALHKYEFSFQDDEVAKMVSLLHRRGGLSGATKFFSHNKAFDFADYRDFLMFSTAKDLRDNFEIWGSAGVDLGEADSFFPMSSGQYNKDGKLGQQRPKQKVVKHFICGVLSAAVSRTIVAPLERAKVLCMVNTEIAEAGFVTALKRVLREESVFGFYKGNTLSVMRIAPTKAVELFVYDNLKYSILRRTNRNDLSGRENLLLGSIAAMSAATVTHPIDTVRSVVMGQIGNKGTLEVTKAIVDNEGWLGLYRGLGPNLIRVAPHGAIKFYAYDKCKQWYQKKIGPGRKIGPIPTMLFGLLAGASSHTLVYPLEMVQRRLQVQATKKGPLLYKNMVDAFQIIVKDEGAGALYAGLLPTYVKLLPAAAISFLAYEAFKGQLDLK